MRLFAYQKEAGIKPNYFDPDTMEPLINTPEGVKALQNYVDTVANGVPGMLQWEWSEAHTCFMTGKCAELYQKLQFPLIIPKLIYRTIR